MFSKRVAGDLKELLPVFFWENNHDSPLTRNIIISIFKELKKFGYQVLCFEEDQNRNFDDVMKTLTFQTKMTDLYRNQENLDEETQLRLKSGLAQYDAINALIKLMNLMKANHFHYYGIDANLIKYRNAGHLLRYVPEEKLKETIVERNLISLNCLQRINQKHHNNLLVLMGQSHKTHMKKIINDQDKFPRDCIHIELSDDNQNIYLTGPNHEQVIPINKPKEIISYLSSLYDPSFQIHSKPSIDYAKRLKTVLGDTINYDEKKSIITLPIFWLKQLGDSAKKELSKELELGQELGMSQSLPSL